MLFQLSGIFQKFLDISGTFPAFSCIQFQLFPGPENSSLFQLWFPSKAGNFWNQSHYKALSYVSVDYLFFPGWSSVFWCSSSSWSAWWASRSTWSSRWCCCPYRSSRSCFSCLSSSIISDPLSSCRWTCARVCRTHRLGFSRLGVW